MTDLPELFVGFALNESFRQILDKIPPKERSLFIQSDGPYLQEMHQGSVCYLGKKAGHLCTAVDLELLATHIRSIIGRLAPQYSVYNVPFVIFSCSKDIPL